MAKRKKQAADEMREAAHEVEEAPALQGTRKFDPLDPAYRAPTIQKLRKGAASARELGEFLGVDADKAMDMVQSLKSAGHSIEETEAGFHIAGLLRPDTVPHMLDYSRLTTDERVIGMTRAR